MGLLNVHQALTLKVFLTFTLNIKNKRKRINLTAIIWQKKSELCQCVIRWGTVNWHGAYGLPTRWRVARQCLMSRDTGALVDNAQVSRRIGGHCIVYERLLVYCPMAINACYNFSNCKQQQNFPLYYSYLNQNRGLLVLKVLKIKNCQSTDHSNYNKTK